MNFSILDCTLRDGGYYINWDFSDSLVDSYIHCISAQKHITHVEIGYRNKSKEKYLVNIFIVQSLFYKNLEKTSR